MFLCEIAADFSRIRRAMLQYATVFVALGKAPLCRNYTFVIIEFHSCENEGNGRKCMRDNDTSI